jgi:hypothetical protein
MEWLLLALVGGGGAFVAKRWRDRGASRREGQLELEGVRRLADEDVTLLGEQLQRLDTEVGDRQLDEVSRLDYQRALDAYESAQRAVARITSAQEISKVTDTLSTGRYALACVQAGPQVGTSRNSAFPASSTRSTGHRLPTSSGRRPAAAPAPCRPARRTRPGSPGTSRRRCAR